MVEETSSPLRLVEDFFFSFLLNQSRVRRKKNKHGAGAASQRKISPRKVPCFVFVEGKIGLARVLVSLCDELCCSRGVGTFSRKRDSVWRDKWEN
jgi:hypothetical protein